MPVKTNMLTRLEVLQSLASYAFESNLNLDHGDDSFEALSLALETALINADKNNNYVFTDISYLDAANTKVTLLLNLDLTDVNHKTNSLDTTGYNEIYVSSVADGIILDLRMSKIAKSSNGLTSPRIPMYFSPSASMFSKKEVVARSSSSLSNNSSSTATLSPLIGLSKPPITVVKEDKQAQELMFKME